MYDTFGTYEITEAQKLSLEERYTRNQIYNNYFCIFAIVERIMENMVEISAIKNTDIMIYTRETIQGEYPEGLAHSIHLAYSKDGKYYKALNQNYGILFAPGTISSKDTIRPKGVKNPWVFGMAPGLYGIVAVSINEDGSVDEESCGKILFWMTENFVDFGEAVAVNLLGTSFVERVQCRYDEVEGVYEILWEDIQGNCFRNNTTDICCECRMLPAELIHEISWPDPVQGPQGAVFGSAIEIKSSLGDKVIQNWSQLHNTEIQLPECITVKSENEVEEVQATAVYSDGSSVLKQVAWDTKKIDFRKKGIYEISGIVQNVQYAFPLTCGYGDPVIFPWENRYYFIATNDNLNDIGLYVREAENVEGLFSENITEHLILGEDEGRGLVQTFWAPEFHVIGDELYILFTVSGKVWGPQCHLMKLIKGGSILDPDSWESPVRIKRQDESWLSEDGITLDMTYLKAGAHSYMVWSYRRNIGTETDTGSMIYIATVDEKVPWQLTSEPVLLSRPLYGWENVNKTINNEGPHGFVVEDTVYLTFSGGAANAYTYALGLLTAKTGANLLEPSNWKKSGTPVLSYYSVEGEYGPGHNSFYTDARGNLMIAYHAEDAIDHNLRCDGIRRVHFNIQGQPLFDMSAERDLDPKLREVKIKVLTAV